MKHFAVGVLVAIIGLSSGVSANAKNLNKLSIQTVKYSCQGDKGVAINYGVNGYGMVNTASFYDEDNDKNVTVRLDQDKSDDVDTILTGKGYRLGADYIDIKNLHEIGGINITAPNNEMIYKDCNPD